MSFDFSLALSSVQIVIFVALLLLFAVELFYLYAIYNRVVGYSRRVAKGRVSYCADLPSVSVVVYAHAEEGDRILQLLPRLVAQRYADFEVIVVNDGTAEELKNAIALYECEYNNVYQTFVPDTVYNVSRKKLGITLGVKAAKNDVIILTDANCIPLSDNWLTSIARNFVPGVDVVLGYTRMTCEEGYKKGGYQTFDRMVFGLRFLAYAVMKAPYMGMGGNLAYRRETFFANKGFSAHLNLHFGDDDLLINEIARKGNTRIEVSPDSMVEACYNDTAEAWHEMRMRYNFTSRFLHTSSKAVFALESCLHILFWLAVAGAVYVALPNALYVATVLLVGLLYWIFTWRVYLAASKLLGERCSVGLSPLYHLLRPCYALYYAVKGKNYKKSNFTWQYLR